MAVSLTAAQLSASMRLGDSAEELTEATRLLAYSTAAVERLAPGAPEVIQNEACIRLSAYLFDMPNAGRGAGHADVLRNSGVLALLLPYRIHRAGSTAGAVAAAQAAVGTVGNPVTGVSITGDELTITFADGAVVTLTLPTGGDGTDQAARDAAASNATAIAANVAAIESNATAIAAIGSPVDSDARATAAANAARLAVLEPLAVSNRNRVGAIEPVVASLDDTAIVDLYISDTGREIYGTEHDGNEPVVHVLPDAARPATWAQLNNGEAIPPAKLVNAPGGGTVTPVSTAILAPFVERYALKGNTDEIDDARLPAARLVPDPSGATDGQVAKVESGAWTIGDDAEGAGGGGGAGAPLVKTTVDVTRLTYSESMVVVEFPTTPIHVAVDTGIAVPVGTKTLLVNYGASTSGATAGIDLLWFPVPIEEWDRLVPVLAGAAPTHDNVRFTRTWRDTDITALGGTQARQVWLLKGVNGNVFVMTDNAGWDIHPFRVRFEIQETITVVADVTGNVDGGGGGGGALSVDAIAGLDAAPNNAVHNRAIFAGVFDSRLYKYEFGHLTALMRSTAGLGRQINPSGNTGNLGKVPVVHAMGGDFHYELQKPAELPTIASNAPTNPAHMNPAILYKDTAESVTADAVYYKRKHDRESVIITFNNVSSRSFGAPVVAWGWSSGTILDTAEHIPGVTPYPSAPTHWTAFIRVIGIASGLHDWRLYTDEMFSSLDTIFLDMRDQDDPDAFIRNVPLTKPVNEAYWSSGEVGRDAFPFRDISARLKRPIIRIRNANDTLSSSIIHLIPVEDVKERIVDEDRLHGVYGDLLDQIETRSGGLSVSRHVMFMPAASYIHRSGGALFFPGGESVWTIPYPAGTTFAGLSAAHKTAVLQADFQHAGISDVGVTANEALPTELWGTHTMGGGTGFRIILAAAGITLAIPSTAVLPANARDGWTIRLSVVG